MLRDAHSMSTPLIHQAMATPTHFDSFASSSVNGKELPGFEPLAKTFTGVLSSSFP